MQRENGHFLSDYLESQMKVLELVAKQVYSGHNCNLGHVPHSILTNVNDAKFLVFPISSMNPHNEFMANHYNLLFTEEQTAARRAVTFQGPW